MEDVTTKISIANPLVHARYDFDLIEKRCLYQIIKAVRIEYIENQRPLPAILDDDMIIRLTPAELNQCDKENWHTAAVYNSLSKLQRKQIQINNEREWFVTSIVVRAKHDKQNNVYEIKVDSSILPYLVELAENFTTIELAAALSFKSIYSQRFYEICSQFRNTPSRSFVLTIKHIRELFNLGDPETGNAKYKDTGVLRKNVIDRAEKEIKSLFDDPSSRVDMWFDYDVKETGPRKAVVSWIFYIHTRSEAIEEADAILAMRREILNRISVYFRRDKKYIKAITERMDMDPGFVTQLYNKIRVKEKKYEAKELPAIMRYILREDFGVV